MEVNELSMDCKNELSPTETKLAEEIIDSFQTSSNENHLGRTDKISMCIETGDAKPFKKRQYHMPPYMLKIPLFISVAGKKGVRRIFCFDGRELNKLTKPDCYLLPRVDRILNYAGGAKFISPIDLRKVFWQILLDLESREKTAFSVPGRTLFYFTVVPFGLCNSAQRQQRLVDKLFGPKYEPSIFCYLDDIVKVSQSFKEHCNLLKEV